MLQLNHIASKCTAGLPLIESESRVKTNPVSLRMNQKI